MWRCFRLIVFSVCGKAGSKLYSIYQAIHLSVYPATNLPTYLLACPSLSHRYPYRLIGLLGYSSYLLTVFVVSVSCSNVALP